MVSQMDALLTHLGTGRWSIMYFIVMSYSSVFLPPHILGGAFLAPRLDYSCRVPANFTFANASFPSTSTSEPNCEYWIDTQDGKRIEKCVEFDFDNSSFYSTFTSEYNLACGRGYIQTSFQSMYMFGVCVGSVVNGYLSDRYGRKRMVIFGYIGFMVLGMTSAWFPFLYTILAARFLMGILNAMSAHASFVFGMEVLAPKMRIWAGFGIYNLWAGSTMLYAGLGYLIRDWRILQTMMTLPGLLVLPVLWMIDESPRWLIVNGYTKEAIQVLGKVARWHGVDLPPETEMKRLVEEEGAVVQNRLQHSSLWVFVKSFVDEALVLLRTPRMRTITLCVFVDFFIASMVYYGIALSGVNLSDDPYMYLMLSGLVEVPAYSLTGPAVERFGRRATLSIFFFTAAVVLLALGVTPAVYSTTVIVLAMTGKMASTGGLQTIIFYSNELFPTEMRSRGMGLAIMVSCIGSMISPFITDLVGSVYPWVPFIVFGLGALLAGAVTMLLPETLGQVLPDTLADVEARSKKVVVEA